MEPEQEETAQRRRALGAVLRIARGQRGWSVEVAAEKASMGHMTLRRLEDGYGGRAKTYAAVDTLLQLPPGSAHRAIGDDAQLVELARQVGLSVSESTSPREVVEGLAPLASRVHDKSGGGAALVSGTGRADLGFAASAAGQSHPPTARTADEATGSEAVDIERIPELRFGPGERIPPRDATIVRVHELLARLRTEQERAPEVMAAEDSLMHLLDWMYGRDHQARREADETEPSPGNHYQILTKDAPELPPGKYVLRSEDAPSSRRDRPDGSGRATGS